MHKFQRLEAVASAASIAAGLVFYGVFIARREPDLDGKEVFTLFDDAMISMRYADNLARGDGLAWNPDGPAVEGYTNFLWTLWMALLHWLGLSGSSAALAVMVTGAILLVLTALCAGAVARRLSGSASMGVLATLITALSYPLAYWTLRGMEVGLLAFLITASILLCLRIEERPSRHDVALLCATVSAMTLTRSDAVVFGLVFIGWLVLRPGFPRRAAGALITVVVATLASHTALRLALYAEALPNTYYLKLDKVPLGDRLHRGFHALVDVTLDTLWLAAALAATAILARRDALRVLSLPAAIVLVATGYSVWVGGDAWEWMRYANRYLAVALPALFALAACGVAAILQLGSRARVAFLALVGLGFAVVLRGHHGTIVAGIAAGAALVIAPLRRTPILIAAAVLPTATGIIDWRAFNRWVRANAVYMETDANSARLGALLASLTPPETTIAVVTAGATPYYARRQTVDLLGKNDAYIAHLKPKGPLLPGHNKWDYDHSIGKLRPDIIVRLGEDPPPPERLAGWGYVRRDCLWVLRTVTVAPELVARVCPKATTT